MKIKIAQIGIGHNHAQGNMEALRKLTDIFDLVGVVESDPQWKAQRGNLPCYQGVRWISEQELLAIPDLQAVAIETDGPCLLATAQRYAERGLHIHCDKPPGESLADFRRLGDTCAARGLALQTAYCYRYNPGIRFAIEAFRAGWLGDIFEIHAVMSRYDGDRPDYRQWLAQYKGGAMYIFAGYLIDPILLMLGRPDRVTPFLKRTRDDGLIDNGLAVLEYPRATATVRVSVEEIDGMKHRRFIVCGTRGTVEICPIETPHARYDLDPIVARLTLKHDVAGIAAVPGSVASAGFAAGTHQIDLGPMGDRYAPQLRELAAIIRGDRANPYDYNHELLLHETVLAAAGYPPETGDA